MISRAVFACVLTAFCLCGRAEQNSTIAARSLAKEAAQAQKKGDKVLFLEKSQQAVGLRPDYPRLLFQLAIAQVANDQPAKAVVTLDSLAVMGLTGPIEDMPEFAACRERADFRAILARFIQNRSAVGTGSTAFSLPGMTGLIEGIAWRRKTGEFYFGDVHGRCVWVRRSDGTVTRFSAADERVFGVFGLQVDEQRGLLWAATTALPQMSGFTPAQKGAAGIVAFDLSTGQVRAVARLPMDGRDHVVGDLILAPDGTLLATDSVAPVLWRLAPGARELDAFLTSEEFFSLQGLTFSQDGRTLYLTDYLSGLLIADLRTKIVRRVALPPHTTLTGSDGLVRTPDGELLVIQNGVQPSRVLRLTLSANGQSVTRVQVLEAAHPAMSDATLGCLVDRDLVFIANGGWDRFPDQGPAIITPRDVPVMATGLNSKHNQ